jgi:hypothetical protein
VWAPRWVGAVLVLRGLFQPLTERSLLREPGDLEEALRLADPASGSVPEQDPLLGVAAQQLSRPQSAPTAGG